MSTLSMVLACVLALLSIALIVVIMLQSNRSAGLGMISGANGGESYWSKNKGNSIEGTLEKFTKIGGALFIILALAIGFIR